MTDTTPRLAARDWVEAAFEIMVDDGIAGVKIARLCERLGVTKGSFYWHFDDVDAFHAELARVWSEHGARPATADDDGPVDAEWAMLDAMTIFSDRWARAIARAMRDWAQNDERAAAAIEASDRKVFGQVRAAFVALGFSGDEAEVRAKILYYAGVGLAHVGPLGVPASTRDQLATTWEILSRR